MKKVLSIFMAVVMTLAVFSVPVVADDAEASAAAPAIIFEADKKEAKPGDIVTVYAMLSANSKLCALTYEVAFDTEYFEYVSDSYKKGANVFTLEEINAERAGIFRYVGTSAKNASDAGGRLFSFQLKVLKVDGTITTAIKEAFVAIDDTTEKDIRVDMGKLSTKSISIACIHGNQTETLVKESNCKENGVIVVTCDDCTKEMKRIPLPLGDHIVGEWELSSASTCVVAGQEVKKCTVCEVVLETREAALADHTAGEEWVLISVATCTEDGKEVKYCTVCGAVAEEKVLPAFGHTPNGEWETAKEVTCTENGKKVQMCTVCGEIAKTQTIPAFGHTANGVWEVAKEPTCAEEGQEVQKCTVCGGVAEEKPIKKVNHNVSDEWVVLYDATCTKDGKQARKCTECGINCRIEVIPATGHTEGEWECVDEGSCVNDDKWVIKCTSCNTVLKTETRHEATGHIPGFWQEKAPTCTEAGERFQKCILCGEVTASEPIEATGHEIGDWEVAVEPTAQKDGKEVRKCKHCGEVIEERVILYYVLGDVDNNGKMSSYDARLILKYVAGSGELTEKQILAADMDGNGKVTSYDARLVLKQVAGN